MKKNGYTLIEVLIVIAIMAILFTIGFNSFQDYQRQQILIAGVRGVTADLHTAEEYALSGYKPGGCTTLLNGYKFNVTSSTTYTISANCTPNTDIQVETNTMPQGLTISTPNPNPIFFKTLGQGTNIPSGGTATITITQTQTAKSHILSIGNYGNVQDIGTSQGATPTPAPTTAPTSTPTSAPTASPAPTPTPTGAATPTPIPVPIGYWKFDDGSGTSVSDSSGNGRTGTWHGTLGSQWTTGKSGNAGNFNGTDSYVDVSSIATPMNTGDVSVSLWFNPTSTFPGGSIQEQFGLFSTGATNGVELYFYTNGTLDWEVDQDASPFYYFAASSQASWTGGTWYHAVGVYSSTSGLTLYVNGVSVGTNTHTTRGTATLANSTQIGADVPAGGTYFKGKVDDVKIYKYALTASQVQYIFNNP